MKLIVDKKDKNDFSYHLKNSMRNIAIVLAYTLGFSVYAFIFVICKKNIFNIEIWWIFVPILGLIMGLLHMAFVYKGSLICRAITMFVIMFFVISIPLVISFV